jgi:cation diffusion facilitator CzcD-associated flavoprotein CzcO
LKDFTGKLYHTATYDDKIDLKGKKVAVIGSGSSGVQTVASIHKDVEKLYHWVRSPIWVTAGYGSKYASKTGENFECENSTSWKPN